MTANRTPADIYHAEQQAERERLDAVEQRSIDRALAIAARATRAHHDGRKTVRVADLLDGLDQ